MTNSTGRRPSYRKLRGYAFDPSLSLKTDTVDINELIFDEDYEEIFGEDPVSTSYLDQFNFRYV